MKIKDRIYGQFEITLPVANELIDSPTFGRLKNVSQFGIPDKYYHLKNFSRYEHSIGVMILLNILGASEEEQIAGLLHDVSHTAFSHTIDYVLFGEGGIDESFQDEHHESIILSSELADILRKYNHNPKRIIDHSNFQLLERDIPNLCADRIDYSLREFPVKIARKCLGHLIVIDNQIVFDNHESAYLFASNFIKKQMSYMSGFENASRGYHFSNVLRHAIEKNILSIDDFWKYGENEITKRVEEIEDQGITNILNALKNRSLDQFSIGDHVRHQKFRHVDPEFVKDKKFLRLSEIDDKFKDELDKAREENKKGVKVSNLIQKESLL